MFGLFRRTPAQQAEDDAKIEASLAKTRQGFFGRIGTLFQANEVTDETWDELEELLIQADLGINTALQVVERLRARVQKERLKRVEDVRAALKDELVKLLSDPEASSHRRATDADRRADRRRQRLGQDDQHRQAGAATTRRGASAWSWPRPTPSAPPPSISSRSGASAPASR